MIFAFIIRLHGINIKLLFVHVLSRSNQAHADHVTWNIKAC